jgi:hypothetical protein
MAQAKIPRYYVRDSETNELWCLKDPADSQA